MRGQFHRDESNRTLPAVSSLLTIAVAFWKGSLQCVRVKQRKNRRLFFRMCGVAAMSCSERGLRDLAVSA